MAAPMENLRVAGGLASIQAAADINGIHTELVFTEYENYTFLLLTQYKKIGTLVEAKRDLVLEQSVGTVTFTTNVLFGKDEPLMHVVARSLAAKIGGNKPILFGLSFKDTDKTVLRTAEDFAMKHIRR